MIRGRMQVHEEVRLEFRSAKVTEKDGKALGNLRLRMCLLKELVWGFLGFLWEQSAELVKI
jgi:hypothetical protein